MFMVDKTSWPPKLKIYDEFSILTDKIREIEFLETMFMVDKTSWPQKLGIKSTKEKTGKEGEEWVARRGDLLSIQWLLIYSPISF